MPRLPSGSYTDDMDMLPMSRWLHCWPQCREKYSNFMKYGLFIVNLMVQIHGIIWQITSRRRT
eukprot:7748940-Pyramimonas_sp.AAC.1